MHGIIVEEYTELDFEAVILESVPAPYCTACGTDLSEQAAGIHQCPSCGSFNHIDVQV
jgi:Zn finger protein HypA/HybF involved in hydrogenase expression